MTQSGQQRDLSTPWWKEAVVYQVYPRSFMDANGDGIGDLQGITMKLDYFTELGIDVLWLSPIYDSPNDDNGYDIRDYYSIMNEFGTMDDFDTLLAEAHKRGIRIIMDLVVNHTSDEHPWFIESRAAKDSPYRKYYFWREQPNNWGSIFSGSAWEYDQTTSEYYLHLFSRKQPDLDWDYPPVREEVYRLMEFWLNKGIDGFRMDVISAVSKASGLPDGVKQESELYASGSEHYMNGPHVHEYLREMNDRVLSHFDVMTVGETPGVTPDEAFYYTSPERKELNMVFQFEHMDLDSGPKGKWDLRPWSLSDLKRVMSKWQTELFGRGWNSLYLNNHDQPRMVSRFGNDQQYRVESAKMLATFLHLLQGTPYIFQGEEIGMTNVRFASIDDYQDVEIKNMWHERVEVGGEDPQQVLQGIYAKGRDNARTPMQWDAKDHAGFTKGVPWLPVNSNFVEINVEASRKDSNSIFYYYQKLIKMRKSMPVIIHGRYELLLPDHEQVYAYTRSSSDETLLVIANFSPDPAEFNWPLHLKGKGWKCILCNYSDIENEARQLNLRPYEVSVYFSK